MLVRMQSTRGSSVVKLKSLMMVVTGYSNSKQEDTARLHCLMIINLFKLAGVLFQNAQNRLSSFKFAGRAILCSVCVCVCARARARVYCKMMS